MRLALKVGRLDWRRALRELSPQEFVEWMAFERIEPFGQEWHQSSRVATSIINEIRALMAGFAGNPLKDEHLERFDALVPGAAELRAAEEALKNKRAVDGLERLVGL